MVWELYVLLVVATVFSAYVTYRKAKDEWHARYSAVKDAIERLEKKASQRVLAD